MPSRRKAKKMLYRRRMFVPPIGDMVGLAHLVVAGLQIFQAIKEAGQDAPADQPAIDNTQDATAEIISSTIKI